MSDIKQINTGAVNMNDVIKTDQDRLEQRLAGTGQVHLIGIGGISMSAIAMFLLERGITVSGSDLNLNDKIKVLRKKGVEVELGHRAENLGGAELVVYSSAIPADNPELEEARQRGIKTLRRAEMLALLTLEKNLVAVSGTHGKTTTTGMLTAIFLTAGLDPDVMVGGDLDLIQGNYRTGQGKYFLTEADESDGSLLYFSPEIAVITNIEMEHMDYYQTKEELLKTMEEFLLGTGGTDRAEGAKRNKREGSGVLCLEDSLIREKLLPAIRDNFPGLELITYGFERGDLQARNIARGGYTSEFELIFQGESQGYFQLAVPGEHNILNALAAAAAANQAGIDWDDISRGLSKFSGVKRRFEIKGEARGITVIDDYAHHPTEIEMLFATAVELDYQRIVTVFQPHRYTRTEKLWQDFVRVLARAPGPLLLTAIYPAHQEPIPGVNSSNLLADIKQRIDRTGRQRITKTDRQSNNEADQQRTVRADQQNNNEKKDGEKPETEGVELNNRTDIPGRQDGEKPEAAGVELNNRIDIPGRQQGDEPEPAAADEIIDGEAADLKAAEPAGDRGKEIYLTPTSEEAAARLAEIVRPGDLVLTAGAGDVYRIGEDFLTSLQNNNF